MNAERLLAHYEEIAEAPGAVDRLRRFVLDLAVRGKLLAQDPSEGAASDLLVRIATEKGRLVKLGEAKAENALLAPNDTPEFQIPSTWCWTRLGFITAYIQRGKSPKYAQAEGVPVISQKCIQWSGLDLSASRQITQESLREYEPIRFLKDGDLLWNSTGTGTIGRVVRVDSPPDKLVCDSHVTVVRCLGVLPEYVRLWLRSDHVYGLIEQRAAGSTNQVELTAQMAINQPVPLAPLAEQHRIVAKVHELMTLCDDLEAARTAREATRDRLTAAGFGRLNTPDLDIFTDDARFVLDVLPALTERADQVNLLRETILTLALRGDLTSRDPSDEPAIQLLGQIEQKRSELLRAGYPNADEARTQLKKLKDQIIPEGLAQLPAGWAWATLLQCSALVVDCKNKTAPYVNKGIRLVRTTNVRHARLNSVDQKYVDQKTYEIWSARCTPEPGDILITREAPMGEVCLIPPGEQICLGQRMMLARLVPGTVDHNFMIYSLRDPNLLDRIQDKPIGATVQHLRVGGVETLLVPLPPLGEQRRIVTRVDRLMELCDQLETALNGASAIRRRLLDALLAEALAPVEPPVTSDTREMEPI